MTMTSTPQCPHCGSHHVRTAAAVYAAGVQTVSLKNRAIGLGAARGGLGVGISRGDSRGTSVSREAQAAAPARTVFISFGQGVLIFIALCVVFATTHVPHAFTSAFFTSALAAVAIPVITGVRASQANADYDRRWMCGACGGTFLR